MGSMLRRTLLRFCYDQRVAKPAVNPKLQSTKKAEMNQGGQTLKIESSVYTRKVMHRWNSLQSMATMRVIEKGQMEPWSGLLTFPFSTKFLSCLLFFSAGGKTVLRAGCGAKETYRMYSNLRYFTLRFLSSRCSDALDALRSMSPRMA